MSLRLRLVVALMVLLAIGMVVYGFGTYRAFERAELERLDEQLRSTVPLVVRALTGSEGEFASDRRGGRGGSRRPVIAAPGTVGVLYGPDGDVVRPLQVAGGTAEPDLSGLSLDEGDRLTTVGSVNGDARWRVAIDSLPGGLTAAVAVPMTSVEQTLDRLVLIETVAGVALLALLASGAWLILRSGLRPLERMAATARSISAGSLDQRVDVAGRDTEVGHLATALNGMLDELEDAFREREATEAKLRRFLADASHELRTPLTSIQGFAELFRLGPNSEHVDLPTTMRRIEEESGRMRRLVEDLLTLARLDETHPTERQPVDLAVLAADACSDAVAMDPERPVRLDAPAPVPVTGDPGHLRQALGNLVANALKHTAAGTPLEVAAAMVDGTATLTVRDHGAGLDDEALERVFDRFWQADPARVGVGAGLGLSIVQAVAMEHGGTATAANAPGGGAMFSITLPTSPPGGSGARPTGSPRHADRDR